MAAIQAANADRSQGSARETPLVQRSAAAADTAMAAAAKTLPFRNLPKSDSNALAIAGRMTKSAPMKSRIFSWGIFHAPTLTAKKWCE